MSKVIIHVYGGIVQAVYSDDPGLEVELFDFDEPEKDEEEFRRAVDGMVEVA